MLQNFWSVFVTSGLGTPYEGAFDPALVLLSIVVAIIAACAALSVSSRIAAATSPWGGWAWTGAGAFSMGGGIWAMHFIGMLAFSLPCGESYNPLGTLLSMMPGILASGVALRLISSSDEPGLLRLSAGAVLMGAGIGAMHYAGMAALEPQALLHYEPLLVAVSVVVAVALAFVSLAIRFYIRRYVPDAVATLIAAPAMGLAVAGMHYTAMKAAVFLPASEPMPIGLMLPPTLMAVAVACISLLVAAIALLGSIAGRQSELAVGLRAEIAERKRAEADLVRAREEAEAANRAKSQFLATMSHEIRTPMNGVLGMANLLAATALNDRQRRLVDNVSRSGQALLGIINDILDVAKIESGKLEFLAAPFEPRETIAEMADLFSERCAEKGLEFAYFVSEDVPATLVGDPLRLRQILVNLVGNSVKFTERGEILVEASFDREEADDVVLRFTVQDTDIGIPSDQHERIFESFHQVDASLTRARGGSGLGLSITRQLVELMGGEISVTSEIGRGSRFMFTARFGRSSRTGKMVRGPQHLPRPLRALLADTTETSAQVTSRYLSSWKVDSVVATSLRDAKTAWRAASQSGQPFDVVILDVKDLEPAALPFAAEIGAADGARSDLILLTGLDAYMVDGGLEQFGAAAVLPKPVRPSELFSALVSISHGDEEASEDVPHAHRRGRNESLPNFGARILIAEDNPVNQEVAAGVLELMGCTTVSAPNGDAAFQLFAQEKFDAILMDCEMPVMDGIEATRRIRAFEATAPAAPDGKPSQRIPIIASTAHAINDVRDKCRAAGMDDFLVKPFNERQVAEALLRWLKPPGTMPGSMAVEDAPQAAAAASAPALPVQDEVIDNAVIDGLRAMARPGRPSPLARAFARFVEASPAIVASIHDNFAKSDADAVWRAAHNLKSSAGALGAKRLSLRCAEIEARAKENGVEAVRPLVQLLDDDLAAAISGLKAATECVHEAA